MKKGFVLLSGLLIGIFQGKAQQDFTLYHNNVVPQATYLNPANTPDSKVNIGLPGISSNYLSISNSGFKWNDAVQETSSGDSLELNMDDMIDKLADLNYLTMSGRMDLLHVGLRIQEDHYFTLNVTEKLDAKFYYPQDFVKLMWEGNGGEFLGQRASLDGLGVDYMHYREYALGYARPLNDEIKVGGKVKYLEGVQNIYTEESTLGLTTDEEDFGWTIDGSMKMRSSGVDALVDTNSEGLSSDMLFGTGNSGFAIDLGGMYELNDEIDISLSVLDLGYIKWNRDLRGYVNEDVSFEYEGMDVYELYGRGDTTKEDVAEVITDSLNATFELEENNESYTTPLNTQIYLGGTYQVIENGKVGALYRGAIVKGRLRSGFSLSYNHEVGNWLKATVNYSMYNRSYLNVGAGFAINGGPVQLYVMTDNLIAPFLPHKTKNLHMRAGINLTFGRDKGEKDEEDVEENASFN